MPNILELMPADGNSPGHIIVGNIETPGASLAWGTVLPIPYYATKVPLTAASQSAGAISVRCFQKGFNTHIVTQASVNNLGYAGSSHNLYWLPWGHGTAAHVSWNTLAASKLFLTSTFTGCRFVANSRGVTHVAWGGHGYDCRGNFSSRGRDTAERKAGTGLPDMGRPRRTLSISGQVMGRPNEQRSSYDFVGAGESCVVIGWRSGTQWTFKAIKMQQNSPMKSRWSTIAQVDVNNGVPNFI